MRNRSIEAELVGPILSGIALIFVAIRVITRRPFISDLFGWDDGVIVLAFLATVLLAISHVFLGRNGMGQDLWTVPFKEITEMLRWFYVGELFYVLSVALTKISILAFYLRVFPSSRFTVVVKSVVAFTAAIGVAFFFALLFQCWPISYSWTRWSGETEGNCIDLNAGSWVHAALNILLDLLILLLPLPMLLKLQLSYSWRKKMRIFVMFSVGLIVTIVSVLRLRTLIVFANTQNLTWDYLETAIWSVVEAAVGVICACLPAAKVFLTRTAPQWFGLTTPSNKYGMGTPARYAGAREWTSTTASGTGHNQYFKQPQKTSVMTGGVLGQHENYRRDFVQLEDIESSKSGENRI